MADQIVCSKCGALRPLTQSECACAQESGAEPEPAAAPTEDDEVTGPQGGFKLADDDFAPTKAPYKSVLKKVAPIAPPVVNDFDDSQSWDAGAAQEPDLYGGAPQAPAYPGPAYPPPGYGPPQGPPMPPYYGPPVQPPAPGNAAPVVQTAHGYQVQIGADTQVLPDKKKAVLFGAGGLALVCLVGAFVANGMRSQPPAAEPAPAPAPAAAGAVADEAAPREQPTPPPVPTPPPSALSFAEIDARMDDRLTTWTDAQKAAYWKTVEGSRVTWQGEVVSVRTEGVGHLTLKCNAKTFASDTDVTLDGTQVGRLSLINRHQRITIEGTLSDHSAFGYDITDARVVGL